MLWHHRELKLYDKVKLKGENLEGYIDAVTQDKFRVRIKNGTYKWCHKHEIELADDQKIKEEPKKKNRFDYL